MTKRTTRHARSSSLTLGRKTRLWWRFANRDWSSFLVYQG